MVQARQRCSWDEPPLNPTAESLTGLPSGGHISHVITACFSGVRHMVWTPLGEDSRSPWTGSWVEGGAGSSPQPVFSLHSSRSVCCVELCPPSQSPTWAWSEKPQHEGLCEISYSLHLFLFPHCGTVATSKSMTDVLTVFPLSNWDHQCIPVL